MIVHIARHEWRRQRAGLTYWLLLGLVQLLVAWLAFAQFEAFARIAPQLKASASGLGATNLVVMPTFNSLILLLLLTAPLLGMGSFAGETRSGRIALWLSSPAGSARIVAGKVLGLWLALFPIVATACLTLAVLGIGVDIDMSRFLLAACSLLLLTTWLAAISAMLSVLFDRPAAALAASYGLLLFLWLLDSLIGNDSGLRTWALLPHTEPLLRGLLRSQDLAYFTTRAAAAMLFTVFHLDRRRGIA